MLMLLLLLLRMLLLLLLYHLRTCLPIHCSSLTLELYKGARGRMSSRDGVARSEVGIVLRSSHW